MSFNNSSNTYNKNEYSTYATSSDPGYQSLVPTTDGSIHYVAYGISEKGRDNPCNGDNIYLNGKYMKSFNFTNYTKSYDAMAGNAVFAVAGAHNNENWAKNAFNALRSAVDLSLSDKNAIQQAMTSFTCSLPLPTNGVASQCLLHITEDGAAVCSLGGAKAFKLKNGELTDISEGSPSNITFTYDKGQRNDTYILCSSGLLSCMDVPQIERLFNQYDRSSAVKEVIQRAKILSGNHDISLIAIDVERTKKRASKPFVKPLVIAGAALVLIVAIIAACVTLIPKKDSSVSHSGETITHYNDEASKRKSYDEKRKAINDDITDANTEADDATKTLRDASSLKKTDEYKACDTALDTLNDTLKSISAILIKADEEKNLDEKLKLIDSLSTADGSNPALTEQLTTNKNALADTRKALDKKVNPNSSDKNDATKNNADNTKEEKPSNSTTNTNKGGTGSGTVGSSGSKSNTGGGKTNTGGGKTNTGGGKTNTGSGKTNTGGGSTGNASKGGSGSGSGSSGGSTGGLGSGGSSSGNGNGSSGSSGSSGATGGLGSGSSSSGATGSLGSGTSTGGTSTGGTSTGGSGSGKVSSSLNASE